MNYCLGENQIEIPYYCRLPNLLIANSIFNLFEILHSFSSKFFVFICSPHEIKCAKAIRLGLAYHVLLFCKNRTVGNLVTFISMLQDKALKTSFKIFRMKHKLYI